MWSGSELDEDRPDSVHAGFSTSATFEMLDKGGMHARTAVLLQKALTGLEFVYVEARHLGNDRIARLYSEQALDPPEKDVSYWLLLLRLEARRGERVLFTACADTQDEPGAAIAAVEKVLGRRKPERHAFWREIGLETYFRCCHGDLGQPSAAELKARYSLFNKAAEDPRPAPPTGPMGRRIS